uniref:Uncharacterized protein n=1 Tax=Tanacetum cinerariifolium TaxID=118510 RepID=A0A6L2NLN5_TANCI|nr:hypothetical protein [Tanacetum cinerariifolium]
MYNEWGQKLKGTAVEDLAIQSLLDLQKRSKASRLESLRQKKQPVEREGSSATHNKYYPSSDITSDTTLHSSSLDKSEKSANETNDAKESNMDLSDDNPHGDDDTLRYRVFMHNKSTTTPNSTYHGLTVTSFSLDFIQTLLDETCENELTDFMSYLVYTDAHRTSVVHNLKRNPELTSYISGAFEVPLDTHVDVLATKTLMQKMFPDENAHHIPSLPGKKIPYPTTTPQPNSLQAKVKKLMQNPKKNMRKINFKKIAVQAKVLTEIKKLLPTHIPNAIANYVRSCLNTFVLEVMKTNQINLFTQSSTSTNDLLDMDLKIKLLNRIYSNKSNETHTTHQQLYDTLYESITLDQDALVAQATKLSFYKRSHESHQDLIGSGYQEFKSYGILKPTRLILTLLREKLLLMKFMKVASPSKKLSPILEEPAEKPKRAKKPAKKSTTVPTSGVVIRDTPSVSVSKKKASTKVDKGKGMDLLSEATLLIDAQLKKTLKKSRLETHKLHASGSCDGVGSQPKVPDESEDKTTGTIKELDVNMRLKDAKYVKEGKRDAEMTNAGRNNGTQQTTYEQVKDDEHVILTTVHDTRNTKVPLQSYSISSDFANQFLILDNVLPTDNEVISMMNVKVCHEEPSTQTHLLLTIPVTVIPKTSTAAAPTIPPIIPSITPFPQQSTPTPTPAPTTKPTTTSILTLLDFSSLFRFNHRVFVLERDLSQLKQVGYSAQLLETIKSYTAKLEKKAKDERKRYIDLVEKSVKEIIKDEPKSTYEAAASLTEFELKKILLDKMQKSKLYRATQEHRDLYDALVKSRQLDKDLFESYGKAYSLKRNRKDKDNDKDPPGTKSQSKSSGKSAQAEESVFETVNTEMPQNQGGDLGNTNYQPNVEAASNSNWFKKSKRLLTPDLDWNDKKSIDFRPPQTWISKLPKFQVEIKYHFEECYKAVTDRIDWNNPKGKEYPFDLSKPIPLIEDQGHQVVLVNYFINNDIEYLKGGSLSRKYMTLQQKPRLLITHVKVMKWYDYGYLKEIEVRREDQQLYKFRKGDFPRLNLCDIEDTLLLLVQKKLSNLKRDVIFDLNMALQMFTRCAVIIKRVEDLYLGVKSYQKKLNITKPETFRVDISKRTTYTAYNNP